MKLTRRGKVVAGVFSLLLTIGAVQLNHYLDQHTKLVNCHQGDEGWTCDTRWK